MSAEELRDHINRIARKIVELEEVAKRKENYIQSKISEEYDPKIQEFELKIQNGQDRLDHLNVSREKAITAISQKFEETI